MGYKLLVTGGRNYNDRKLIRKVLSKLHKEEPITLLIQGWARGVDQLAHQWAIDHGVKSTGMKYRITQAMWSKYGNGAGPVRNEWMYDDSDPDMVLGFHGGNGTAHMIEYARRAGCLIVVTVSEKGVITCV